MKNGIFITVEGPNGAGKSSFIDGLASKLSTYTTIYLTKEPSPTEFGDFVKRYEHHLSGEVYARLIWSDRYYHVEKYVIPKLNLGKVVISDRYIESNFVLQGFDGVSNDTIWSLNQDFIIPDISIVLLADPKLLDKRLSQRDFLTAYEKKMTREQEVDAYHKTMAFLAPKGFHFLVLDNNTVEDMGENISEVCNRVLSLMR